MTQLQPHERWLIALDIDGTLVENEGVPSQTVIREVERVRALGHEVVLATGHPAAMPSEILWAQGVKLSGN